MLVCSILQVQVGIYIVRRGGEERGEGGGGRGEEEGGRGEGVGWGTCAQSGSQVARGWTRPYTTLSSLLSASNVPNIRSQIMSTPATEQETDSLNASVRKTNYNLYNTKL